MTERIGQWREAAIRALARRTMRAYEPGMIAVAGEADRALQVEAIAALLRNVRHMRTESGFWGEHMALPMAVVTDARRGSGAWFWVRTIARAWWATVVRKAYPELLVIACRGASHDETRRFLEIARPQMTVVTGSDDAAAYRAAPLVEALPSNGYGVMDADRKGAGILSRSTRAHVTTFGFMEGAAMRVTNFATGQDGISFTLEYGGKAAPVRIAGAKSKDVASACAGAACVGIAFGMNLARIAAYLGYLEPPERILPQKGR